MFDLESNIEDNSSCHFGYSSHGTKVEVIIRTVAPNVNHAYELRDHLITLLETVLNGNDPVCSRSFDIDKIWYNKGRKGISTTILWKDGIKTTVTKVDDEVEDPEKSLAMCYAKKALGNRGNYYNLFRHFLPIMTEQTGKKEKKQDETSKE